MRVILAMVGLCAIGCSDPPASKYPSTPVDLADSTLGVGDLVDIQVHNHADLNGPRRVSESGTISFPYIGDVEAAGRTPQGLAKDVERRLADGYYKEPYVTVLVKEYASKKVSVFGWVEQPGTLTFTQGMTIVEAISRAGGFKARAQGNGTKVTRVIGEKQSKYTIPVQKIGDGKADNFYMRPGDVVYVPRRAW